MHLWVFTCLICIMFLRMFTYFFILSDEGFSYAVVISMTSNIIINPFRFYIVAYRYLL